MLSQIRRPGGIGAIKCLPGLGACAGNLIWRDGTGGNQGLKTVGPNNITIENNLIWAPKPVLATVSYSAGSLPSGSAFAGHRITEIVIPAQPVPSEVEGAGIQISQTALIRVQKQNRPLTVSEFSSAASTTVSLSKIVNWV